MAPGSAPKERHSTSEAPASMWEFVTVAEYVPPPPDVVETTKRRLSSLWRRLRRESAEPATPVKTESELTGLPAWWLQRAAPPPPWARAAEALDTAFGDWVREPAPDESARLVVTPPHIRRDAILTAWAEAREWRVVSPPAYDDILSGGESWLREAFADGVPWVVPNVERLYLRHAEGLGLVCRFLEEAHAGRLGWGLMGCDSWGWAFLRHVWRGWLPPKLTLQAFDEGRLAACFRGLAAPAGGEPVRFRQSDDGSDVLPLDAHEAMDTDYRSGLLHHLATYSRGNLGVAWAIWRTALSSEPVGEAAAEAEADERVAGKTIWVTPWSRVERPAVPLDAGRDTAFVLHALLIHGDLPAGMVARLLPMRSTEITEVLDTLRVAGLVAQEDGRWQVTARGYPPVREFLEARGYLTDDF